MHHIRDDIDRVLQNILEHDRKVKAARQREADEFSKRLDDAIARQKEGESQT